MKLLSLFDGEGGFPLAAVRNGIEPVAASEIEPYPIAITRSRFPRMKHLGDIAFVNGADIEPVDIVTFGSPCFPAGTLVLTERGYREIELLSVGERVLTHTGRWMPITDIGFKFDETIVLHGNHMGLECTKNHPIYSAERIKIYPRKEDGKRTNAFKLTDKFDWVSAEDMAGKLWGVPRSFDPIQIPIPSASNLRQKEMPELNADAFYLIGRWIGDGWVRDGQRSDRPDGQHFGTIVICSGKKREDSLRSAVERVIDKYHVEKSRTANKYIFTSQLFSEWIIDNFGKYAHGKTIPAWAFGMGTELREALLRGILESDGHEYSVGNFKVTSVSKKLVEGIRLLAETLGYSTTTYFTERPKTTVIEGRTVNQRDTYTVVMTKSKVRKALKNDLHSWYLVRRIDPQDTVKKVYNISVERDNSYVANGIVVHNCQDMSVAGKRAGLQHEELGDEDSTRSGLFFEAVRIIKEMRKATNGKHPRFAVWENVPGAFSSNGGRDFLAVLQAFASVREPAVSIPEPARNGKSDGLAWLRSGCIVGNGWSLAWRQLDAQYFGVPQRRKRIYLVADFGSECAEEILLERYCLRGDSTESGETREGTSEDAKRCVDGSCAVECLNPWDSQTNRIYSDNGKHPAVSANSGGGQDRHAVAIHQNADGEVRTSDKAYTVNTNGNATGRNSPVIALQANGIDRADNAGCNGAGWREDQSYTLNTVDRHAVCYPDVCGTLAASGAGSSRTAGQGNEADFCIVSKSESNRRFIVRRLMPIETTRLQGYPKIVEVDMKQATSDEVAIVAIKEGFIRVIPETGEVYATRGPGGIVRSEPLLLRGTVINGYVIYKLHAAGAKKMVRANRLVWIAANGSIPSGMCVDHINSNKKDNRISNLQLLTPGENSKKAYADGLYKTGDLSSATKIKERDRRVLSFVYWHYKIPYARIAPMFGIKRSRAQQIIHEYTWHDLAPFDGDVDFWESVRKTWAEINGKQYRPFKSVEQLEKWYNGLRTDAAEYKADGNSLAIPCAEYVIRRIAETVREEEKLSAEETI